MCAKTEYGENAQIKRNVFTFSLGFSFLVLYMLARKTTTTTEKKKKKKKTFENTANIYSMK